MEATTCFWNKSCRLNLNTSLLIVLDGVYQAAEGKDEIGILSRKVLKGDEDMISKMLSAD